MLLQDLSHVFPFYCKTWPCFSILSFETMAKYADNNLKEEFQKTSEKDAIKQAIEKQKRAKNYENNVINSSENRNRKYSIN